MRLLKLLLVLIACTAAAPAVAEPLEDGMTAYKRGDYETALRLWRPLAEQGDARAQGILAIMYREGLGVPNDYATAVAWSRKAAEQGSAAAQFDLGRMYLEGLGVSKDIATAISWYRKAAEQGDKNAALEKAMKHLGLFERDNRQQGQNLAIQVNLVGPAAPAEVQAKRVP